MYRQHHIYRYAIYADKPIASHKSYYLDGEYCHRYPRGQRLRYLSPSARSPPRRGGSCVNISAPSEPEFYRRACINTAGYPSVSASRLLLAFCCHGSLVPFRSLRCSRGAGIALCELHQRSFEAYYCQHKRDRYSRRILLLPVRRSEQWSFHEHRDRDIQPHLVRICSRRRRRNRLDAGKRSVSIRPAKIQVSNIAL